MNPPPGDREQCSAADVEQFHYRDGELHCEDVPLAAIADSHGTPLYVYSRAVMEARFASLQAAFGAEAHLCYAVKANGNRAILQVFAALGAGFDVVSGGELRRLGAAGVGTKGVVFAGMAKEAWEIEAALAADILLFNVESPYEIDLLAAAAAARGDRVPIALRLNPDVAADTHDYIRTAGGETKFGVDFRVAAELVQRIRRRPELELRGYHIHLGSQLRDPGSYLDAFSRVEEFLDADAAHRQGVRYYDLGGGFGIAYGEGRVLDVAGLAAALLPRLRARGLCPVLEPGRYLVGDAGVLVTTVLGRKRTGQREFLLVDAAMNDLLRPALYRAEHPVAPLRRPANGDEIVCDVVGPVCETGDFLARERRLPAPIGGDRLAVFAAGAYGASMASNYNSRRRPAEVLVSGADARLIRRRERFDSLWADEEGLT